MVKHIFTAALLFIGGLLGSALHAQTVTNVTAEQQGTALLIHYNLQTDSPCEVQLFVSLNGGKSWIGPLLRVSGDVGKDITAGNHTIRWEVLEEQEQLVGNNIQFKVVANGKKWLEPEMVFVKGGTFMMGSNSGEDDERPVHQVTLSDFSIGKFEVTVRQFAAFIDASGYRTDEDKDGGSYIWTDNGLEKKVGVNWRYDAAGNRRNSGEDDHPVMNVSWNDVEAYCKWLSGQTGKKYRLPTEAEWEYAARGGNQSRNFTYSGSNDIGSVAWYSGNSENKTHAVGTKQANELEIYDMSGNVWEWCSDWYGSYNLQSQTNPSGPTSGRARVVRGGSWGINPDGCQAAVCLFYPQDFPNMDVGFRLVLAPVR